MLIDSILRFTALTGQALTGNAQATYEIDCGETDADLGRGTHLVARFVVIAAFNADCTVAIQSSTTNSGYADLIQRTMLSADIDAIGDEFDIPLPAHHHRWLTAYFTITGAGTIAGWLDISA